MASAQRAQGTLGPRIYNLFPLLVGPIAAWQGELPRIAAMGFDWLYLNPFHYPGFSGSLYAIKDPYRLHDLFDAEGEGESRLRQFLAAAHERGLAVMMDLVINHTARDALLAGEHPDWYKRGRDGDFLSPRAVDVLDQERVTVWGDLAELDYERPGVREALFGHWSGYVRHHLALGFDGFRCDAAYMVPAEFWRRLIDAARREKPDCLMAAETLGCSLDHVETLHSAGFDYLFNSSKWWDFRSDWLLDQYERHRRIAPSIAFPESHDTERLAAESRESDPERAARRAKFAYQFAACFSSGVMIPIGFEQGFRRRLDVVCTRPEQREAPQFDISDFIAAVNAMKATLPVLNREGPQRRLTSPGHPVVVLLRETPERDGDAVLLLMNPDAEEPQDIDPAEFLPATGGPFTDLEDVTPQASPVELVPGIVLRLEALEARVFRARQAQPPARLPTARGSSPTIAERGPPPEGRLTIENVWPEIDGGLHPIKRVAGEVLEVWADIFCDGHDQIAACLAYREQGEEAWREAPMAHWDNDRWIGRIPLARNGRYLYRIEAWRDLFASWRRDLAVKRKAGQPVSLEIAEGLAQIEFAAKAAKGRDAQAFAAQLARLQEKRSNDASLATLLASEALADLMRLWAPRSNVTRYRQDLEVVVDRTAGRFSAWYELFPRSMSGDPKRHGRFEDVIQRLPYVRDMGFDVLYFPPIHPIGRTNRKGRNNSLRPGSDDPGSPYAIGAPDGGHDAIHPALGGFEEFRRLIRAARREGLEIALDFAIQCSPDHPWIAQHPEWFDWRPDGSLKHAENPPKKYEDIVNVHFYRQAFPDLWHAWRDVLLFWIGEGVRIFRVDNPHTKPVPFWAWLIREIQDRHPDVIFLSEAFTRPKMMRKLAKAGFTQSYSYFTWRNSRLELTEYLTELTSDACKEYLRPNFFTNTPDINPTFLQTGGRPGFQIRAALAATLSPAWGTYCGFELCEARALPGREEYLNSEKYEIRAWDWNRPGNIRAYIARLNRIRRENPALQELINLRFHPVPDESILCYSKSTARGDNVILVAVNLDPLQTRRAVLPLGELGPSGTVSFEVEELLTEEQAAWRGANQEVTLDPQRNPCAIWRLAPAKAG